jgi:hypothetical protein
MVAGLHRLKETLMETRHLLPTRPFDDMFVTVYCTPGP